MITAVRWSARVLAALLFLLITMIAIGEGGPPNPWGQPWKVNVELDLMLAIWVGLILAWKWEALGGILMAGGVTAFCAVEGRLPNGLFAAILLAGAAFIGCWLAERSRRAEPASADGATR
jgi:hypothetical protein